MGAARDRFPDPNRANDLARPPLSSGVRRLSPSGIVPATPPRPPRILPKSGAIVLPVSPVPTNLRPPGRQPKILDHQRDARTARRYGTCTFQKLLRRQDVRITMIYTHVLNRGGKGVCGRTETR